MDELRVFTDYLIQHNIEEEKGRDLINNSKKIGDLEKLLIYSYCYPRKIGDYELPNIIKEYRESHGIDLKGLLIKNPEEACILVEAFRSLQYGRFMRHLMHAFIEKPEVISSVAGEGVDTCPICGKTIYYIDSQYRDKINDKEDETLAFMSSESSVCMCKDCLLQLAYSTELISKIEGPDFLSKWGNASIKTPNP